MNWTEFREFVASAAVALGTVAAVVLTCLLLMIILGAAIGATAGAIIWSFHVIAGGCK